MKKLITILFVSLATGVFAQQKQEQDFMAQSSEYSTEYAQKVIGHMCNEKFMGREAGSKENFKIMKFIEKELKKTGCHVYRQPITSEALVQAIGEPKPDKTYPAEINNVIARIDGQDPNKYIIIGAHYDHLGYKEGIGIHPGADDNASGIVALISLAKMMSSSGIIPKYTILFCAWDGEEKGLLGSKYFVADWFANRIEKDSICYYMNFDMVGRTASEENPAVTFSWNDNFPYLKGLCENAYAKIEQPFKVIYDQRFGDGKGGSDYAPFSAHNIPFVAWMEDEMHEDYHKPGDTPDKIHWVKLQKTILLAYGVLYEWAR